MALSSCGVEGGSDTVFARSTGVMLSSFSLVLLVWADAIDFCRMWSEESLLTVFKGGRNGRGEDRVGCDCGILAVTEGIVESGGRVDIFVVSSVSKKLASWSER